ncbi:MAG: polyhydroxyalkanoate synthesis repressor PhaR [Pseudomonadota bacterium]
MPTPYLVKKYANRRLYDTQASRHVTLDGIRDLIVAGKNVKIVDDASGEDLTRGLLLQIIADQEQAGRPILDAELLTRLIRLYGNPMQDLLGEFLLKSFDSFMSQQSKLQDQMRAAMAATPLATLQEMASSQMKAWQDMQQALLGTARNPSASDDAGPDEPDHNDSTPDNPRS